MTHTKGSHSDDRGGDADLLCYCDDIDQAISNMDWKTKDTLLWRGMFMSLMQYRDKLSKDMKHERIAHLDEFIAELREARSR